MNSVPMLTRRRWLRRGAGLAASLGVAGLARAQAGRPFTMSYGWVPWAAGNSPVTQYMIGFGKTLFSFRRGETEYGVKAIPLGGYISMIGMFPPGKEGGRGRNATTGFMQQMVQDARVASSETVSVGEEERTFYRLPVWKRIVIMFGGPFMNLVIGVVLFGVLLMGFGAPQSSTTLATVSQCVPE